VLAFSVGSQFWNPYAQALAAIERSIVAAGQDIARKYLISVSVRDTQGRRETIEHDLYVQGNDRFAVRVASWLPGRDMWLGKEADEAWVVPAMGPVRAGDQLAFNRWLESREELSTPYLHVTTVLHRMSRGYRLTQQGFETIDRPDGSRSRCRRIVGNLKESASQKLPATIQLWADDESGVAMRLTASWNLPPDQAGRESVTIQLIEQPDLPEDWFRAAGHYREPRRVLRFDSSE
jgi:hypothetical protein